jgi:hypothetical protein
MPAPLRKAVAGLELDGNHSIGRDPLRPVAGRGRITAKGYQPENVAFLAELTEIDDHGRRVGRDPCTIPLDVLTAAGHPRSSARDVIRRMQEASEASSGVADRWVLFPLTQNGDARLTTDGRQWIVERREHGQWRELGSLLTRVGIWQVCVDNRIVVGWDAEEAIQALPDRFVREKPPGLMLPRACQGGEPAGSLTTLRERFCSSCRAIGSGTGPNKAEIRRCDIIDCSVWPYRLGFNPHNPKRGKNPFAEERADARSTA